ncbi:hypothetical protein C5167_036838 [Papaver somniferum]|uniref:ABC transporter domain-containing protein n=1 Tax=Papaver somniferum TaxID=3469 RepID=A0A4Y7I4P3_PAPSO|nr:hypothetical protein C5167_036838 [Papaver somniferum]
MCFIRKKCGHRSGFTEELEAEKYPGSIRLGSAYRATIGCSVLLTGVHLLMLLRMLNGDKSLYCESKLLVFCQEILQVVSWLITLLMVITLPNSRSLKLPWVLRAWWILSFLLSVIHTVVDTRNILINHKSPGVGSYADFLGLIASAYLLGISVRGTTGISFITNSNTEPLLRKTEKHPGGKREKESPYSKATLLQLITFSWLTPLFKAGYKKALEQDDIPDIDIPEFLSHLFSDSLRQVKERDHSTNNPSIYKAIFLLIRKKAAVNAVFAVVNAGASYVGPYLINDFVAFLSQKKNYSVKTGYIIALAFLSAKMVEVIAQRQLGMRLRAALISHIYKKGLHLSSQSRQKHSSGEIINLMSVDINRITDFIWFMNTIWMLPIQISLATHYPEILPVKDHGSQGRTLVFYLLGIPALISAATFGACILLRIPLTAGKVLSALATFRMLQDPIFTLTDSLSAIVQAKISVDRVASYLQEDEIQEDAVISVPKETSEEVALEIENGRFSWDPESRKSSLLSCIIGEIPKIFGTVKVSGTKGYVPQSSWILTGNIRDNILFGNPYDQVKYERTVRACALTKDFELFQAGDLTEIGERGINMSGGQKQRIQLARAAYQDADIYILDDPFSAVDAHTGRQLFEECLMGILKDKTIFYVTHQVEFLPSADGILIASNYWMAWASPITTDSKPVVDMKSMFLVYIVLSCAQGANVFLRFDSNRKNLKSSIYRSKCAGFGITREGGLVCFLNHSNSGDYCSYVTGCMASICHLHPSDGNMHMVPGKASFLDCYESKRVFLFLLTKWAFKPVVLVSLPEGVIKPSIAGLAVTYGLNLNVLQASVIWNLCNAENKMISVERISQYSKLSSEAPLVIENCRPPSNWPEFERFASKTCTYIRYAEHLPSVLKNINCTVPGRKKVGVVGRTGSGKSTLIQVLFRTVEPKEGSIVIDDIDISSIGLHDLRSKLSIIPQDPTLFEGTIRGNLDPLEQFSDREIWEALDKCQLGDLVRAKEEKLDSPAIASVDTATDGIVQKIITRKLENCTVVTVAHRIHTVIDSDLVLVLSEGRVMEYDTPAKLLRTGGFVLLKTHKGVLNEI